MPTRQKVVVLLIGFSIFFTIIYLVREKKLKEEYSWLWLLVGTCILSVSLNYDLLLFFTELTGAVLPTSTLFFFGLVSLVLICLQFSIRISQLTEEHKKIVQKIAIMDQELEMALDVKRKCQVPLEEESPVQCSPDSHQGESLRS